MENQRLEKLKGMLALSTKPDSFLQYAIALEYAGSGHREEAIHWFEETLKTDPEYLPVYYHLARHFSLHDQTENAIQLLKKGQILAKEKKDTRTLAEISNALTNLEMGLSFDDDD